MSCDEGFMKSILPKRPFFSDHFIFILFDCAEKMILFCFTLGSEGYPPFSDFKATDFPFCSLLLDFAVKYLYLGIKTENHHLGWTKWYAETVSSNITQHRVTDAAVHTASSQTTAKFLEWKYFLLEQKLGSWRSDQLWLVGRDFAESVFAPRSACCPFLSNLVQVICRSKYKIRMDIIYRNTEWYVTYKL